MHRGKRGGGGRWREGGGREGGGREGGGREGERKQYGQSGDIDHPIFIDEITVIMEYNFYWSHDPHISWRMARYSLHIQTCYHVDEITVIMEYNLYWSHDPHIGWPDTVSISKHATMLMKSQ